MRLRATPTNPNTIFQQEVKGFFSQLAALWSITLTLAQRQAWDAYAAAVLLPNAQGYPRNVGGLGMYIRSNSVRMQAGLARVDDGPTNHTLAAMTNPNLTTASVGAGNSVDFTYDNTDAWATATGGALLFWGSRSINVTRNFFKGPYRFAGSVLGDDTTPPTSPGVVEGAFPNILGLNLHGRFRCVTADGRVSSSFRDHVVVTA
jgi:hypothetical protein